MIPGSQSLLNLGGLSVKYVPSTILFELLPVLLRNAFLHKSDKLLSFLTSVLSISSIVDATTRSDRNSRRGCVCSHHKKQDLCNHSMQTTCNDMPQLNPHKHAPAIGNKTSQFSYCLRIKKPKMNLYMLYY